jgi:hypothetical protein
MVITLDAQLGIQFGETAKLVFDIPRSKFGSSLLF